MAKKNIVPGRDGGLATLKKYGAGFFSEMAKKAHRRRVRLARAAQKGTPVKKRK